MTTPAMGKWKYLALQKELLYNLINLLEGCFKGFRNLIKQPNQPKLIEAIKTFK